MAKSMSRRKPFFVFEAGPGKVPIGLIKQAVRAENRGLRKRHFKGSDLEAVNLDKLLKKLGISRKPANLEIAQKCAIQAVQEIKPNSQHIIFGSYFLNYIATYGKSGNMLENAGRFISVAKRALKPGGRLVFVLDKVTALLVEDLALNYGMGFHKRELSDQESKKSLAKFIRRRASPEWRARLINSWLQSGLTNDLQIISMMKQTKVSKPDELLRPTVFVLRKPREGETKILAVTRLGAGLIEDPAIRSAVRGILR